VARNLDVVVEFWLASTFSTSTWRQWNMPGKFAPTSLQVGDLSDRMTCRPPATRVRAACAL
jgi:hypothetical protein